MPLVHYNCGKGRKSLWHYYSSDVFKGSKWGALLVAGDDDDQEKAKIMKEEILELERVITSQTPRIIGIR